MLAKPLMPILQKEVDVFPATLLESEFQADPDSSWWAFYTRSRREKSLTRRLLAAQIPFYAPVVPRRTCSPSMRVRTSFVPLFPNYVFMFGTQAHRYAAMQTNCISRWVEVHDGERLQEDLRQVHRLIEMDIPLTVEARLVPGRRVRVRSGAFAGFEGVVLKRLRETRLYVCVDFLQQSVSVELADCQVEPS